MTEARPRDEIPSAIDRFGEIAGRLVDATPAVFLDYDGTLTPIVEHPDLAVLSEAGRESVRRLAELVPVAVISGRDTADVRDKVDLPDLIFAGSHGFDIQGVETGGEASFEEYLPALQEAADAIEEAIADVAGAHVERKRFAVAVHFRQVESPSGEEAVEGVVARVAARHPRLRRTGGKKIFELRPDVDWDKGRALEHVLRQTGLDREDVVPFYLGDDLTDEDAFRALLDQGIGIVVGRDGEPSLAHYALDGVEDVYTFLDRLAELVRS